MNIPPVIPIDPHAEPKHPRFRRAIKPFLAGMATLIPVLATGYIVVLVFKLLHRIGLAIINGILQTLNAIRRVDDPHSPDAWSIDGFPGDDFLWLLIPLAILFLVGLAVTNRPGHKIMQWIDHAIIRIPIVGAVYSTAKQFVDAVRNLGGPQQFKGVAFVEYPSPGCRLVGFITGNYTDPQTQQKTTSVFIPTSPNPMTGFVLLIDDEKIIPSSMTLEEAGKMIISAGLVAPPSFAQGVMAPHAQTEKNRT